MQKLQLPITGLSHCLSLSVSLSVCQSVCLCVCLSVSYEYWSYLIESVDDVYNSLTFGSHPRLNADLEIFSNSSTLRKMAALWTTDSSDRHENVTVDAAVNETARTKLLRWIRSMIRWRLTAGIIMSLTKHGCRNVFLNWFLAFFTNKWKNWKKLVVARLIWYWN